MIEASGQRGDELCAACFDGHYPIELPDDSPMSAAVRALAAEVDGLEADRFPVRSDIADPVRRP
jgi:amidophosphoribosyltransferase